jgi:excisionase family DNA binding protein
VWRAWQAVVVDDEVTGTDDGWLTYADAALLLGVSSSKVRQMVRDHELASTRRPGVREHEIPAAFLDGGTVVKGLPGTLVLLADHGLSDDEAIEWLFKADDSLPGRPIDALRGNRGKEVHRRAQVIT